MSRIVWSQEPDLLRGRVNGVMVFSIDLSQPSAVRLRFRVHHLFPGVDSPIGCASVEAAKDLCEHLLDRHAT